MDLAQRVRKIIIEVLEVDAAKVVDAANCQQDLGADSLDLMQILMSVEDEFETELPDDLFAEVKTVGDFIAVIRAKVEA